MSENADDLEMDAMGLFAGFRRWHMSYWLYQADEGLKKWAALAHVHKDHDIDLIEAFKDKIPEAEEMMEIGPGDPVAVRDKSGLVFNICKAKTYVGFDGSPAALQNARDYYENIIDTTKVHTEQANFFKPFNAPIRLEKPLLFCGGLTLGNLPNTNARVEERLDQTIIEEFVLLRNAMQNVGHLVFTNDPGPSSDTDGEYEAGEYDNEENSEFTLGLIDYLTDKLKMRGVKRKQFAYKPEWNSTGFVSHSLVAKTDVSAQMFGTSVVFLEKGRQIYTNRSIKLSNARIERNLEFAGFHEIQQYSLPTHRRTLFIAAPASPAKPAP
jgi:hypothetical protein